MKNKRIYFFNTMKGCVKMKLIIKVIIFISIIAFIIYLITIKKTESIGPYKLKKVSLFEKTLLYPYAFVTNDDYIVYYNDYLLKWRDSWSPSSIKKRFDKKNEKLSELDFKEYRDAKMYFNEHPYSYKPYMDYSNDVWLIRPDNYTIIDRYVIEPRDELISKIEHMNYLSTGSISFSNLEYENLSRVELLKIIESLSNKSERTNENENK